MMPVLETPEAEDACSSSAEASSAVNTPSAMSKVMNTGFDDQKLWLYLKHSIV